MPQRRDLLVASLASLVPALAGAQETWPAKPVRIVVPYPPGGSTDVLGRQVALHLGKALGSTVIVDNRAGATGTIGAAEVARAAPDGHTLLAMDNTYAMLPHLFGKLPFDHAAAFRPVTVSAFSPVMLAVHRDAPWRDLASLIAAAKREPDKISYGTGGIGSAPHFATAAFAQAAGVTLFHVPCDVVSTCA